MARVITGIAVVMLWAAAVYADFDAGLAAYDHGDFATALREWAPLAEKGDVEAQYRLGLLYIKGEGVAQDGTKAMKWLRKAAENGHAQAQYRLAVWYEYNSGQRPHSNDAEALKWYRKAAEQGSVEAQSATASMYRFGWGAPRNSAEAVKWYRRAAEQGFAEAQRVLGEMCLSGEGTPQDVGEGVRWYRMAADQGDSWAQYRLAEMYDSGKGVARDYTEAAMWYRKLADQNDREAQYRLAEMYYSGQGVAQDYTEAAVWYRKVADREVTGYYERSAQFALGYMYATGQGVNSNSTEAMKWYRKAADQGHADAQNNLGSLYASVIIVGTYRVPPNYTEAARWFRLAAEQGNDAAQYNLGSGYLYGQGVPQDFVAAARWFGKAAQQGSTAAQLQLGIMYADGKGVPHDPVLAYFWLNVAAAAGSDAARQRRDQVADSILTPDQIARAQRLSRDWVPGAAVPVPSVASKAPPRARDKHIASGEQPKLATTGSGFFVSARHVLTNQHVIDNCYALRVNIAGHAVEAQLVAHDPANDLALIGVKKTANVVPAEFRQDGMPRLGEAVVVAGYPLRGLLTGDLGVTTGTVAALAGIGDDARLLQISAPVQPGNSGGPLLDSAGRVIGVVVAKLDALKVAKATGTLPENINFAVKAALARSFLDIHGIRYRISSNNMALRGEEIAALARRFTAVVECLR